MCLPVKPFKVEREWEFSGLKCAVVMNREHGHRCGYVRVPPDHPSHGKPYEDMDVSVHGGLTFAGIEPCAHDDGQGFWFGFDCAHYQDASYEPGYEPNCIRDLVIPGEHWWTEDEVAREAEYLALQLASLKAQPSKPDQPVLELMHFSGCNEDGDGSGE